MKNLGSILLLTIILAIGVNSLHPVHMFDTPCTFDESVKQLKMSAKNLTNSMSQISKKIKGNKDYVKKIKTEMGYGIDAIDSVVAKLHTLSVEYEKCCQSLENIYGSYHHKTKFLQDDSEFDKVVQHFKTKTISTYSPTGPHVDNMNRVLNEQKVKMAEILDNMLKQTESEHKIDLGGWYQAYTVVRDEREETRRLSRGALCQKATQFNKELQSKVGSVAFAALLPIKGSLQSLFSKRGI